jgi:hypothetical protein
MDETQLIAIGKMFAGLGAKPEFSEAQAQAWVEHVGVEIHAAKGGSGNREVKDEASPPSTSGAVPPSISATGTAPTFSLIPTPRLPVFDGGEKDTSFQLWKNEVRCLARDQSQAVVIQAVRRSLKGKAADLLLHMGDDISVDRILEKFEVIFGEVKTAEQLLESFYSAKQTGKEDVAAWGCRLEDIVTKLKLKGAVDEDSCQEMLRTKFWSGLFSKDVKMALRHHFDQKLGFEVLVTNARSVEAEFSGTAVKVQVQGVGGSEDKLDTILKTISGLDERLSKIEEKGKGEQSRGGRPFTRCYRCDEAGHFARECPIGGEARQTQ